MEDFWLLRKNDAQRKAHSALSSDLRDVYLQLAAHYESMSARSPLALTRNRSGFFNQDDNFVEVPARKLRHSVAGECPFDATV